MLQFYPTYVQTIPHYDQTNYYWFQFGFNYAEIKKMEKIIKKFPYQEALVETGNGEDISDKLDTSIRKSKIKWFVFALELNGTISKTCILMFFSKKELQHRLND